MTTVTIILLRYLVKVGDYNLSRIETSQQEIVPEMILVHSEFKNSSCVDGDIALVKLSKKVKLNSFIRTVYLPKKEEGDLAIPSTSGVVTGWGTTRALRPGELAHRSDISKVLRYGVFTISLFKQISSPTPLNHDILCWGRERRKRPM